MRVRSNSSSNSSRSVSVNSQHSTVRGATLSLQSPHISQSWPGTGSNANVFTLHMHWRETLTASETYMYCAAGPVHTCRVPYVLLLPRQSVSQVAKHNGQRSGYCCFDLFRVFK